MWLIRLFSLLMMLLQLGSMTACYYLLRYAGAKTILPLALLETANYEE